MDFECAMILISFIVFFGVRKIGLDENKVRFNVEFDKLEDLKGMYFYSSSENQYIEAKIEKE